MIKIIKDIGLIVMISLLFTSFALTLIGSFSGMVVLTIFIVDRFIFGDKMLNFFD